MVAVSRWAPLWADAAVLALVLLMIWCTQVFETTHGRDEFSGPLQRPRHPRIEVAKSARVLSVYDGERLVKKYRICTGKAGGDKEREGDHKTPEGSFFVCYKNPHSRYTLSLGLSYPNEQHASRGLKAGLITQAQYDALIKANRATESVAGCVAADGGTGSRVETRADGVETISTVDWEKLWKTPLGGEIMIHGAEGGRAGTAGCVGMDDGDIRELYAAIPVGTPVVISP